MSNLFRSSDEKVIVIEQGDITKLAVDATKIAIREVKAFPETHPDVEVTLSCFSKRDKDAFERLGV